ncbi:MAG: hypothetical protein QM536_08215 [Chitinophagaceae bacterium]|nr:hypothetical protein [Chitinophagaceae bacterium]
MKKYFLLFFLNPLFSDICFSQEISVSQAGNGNEINISYQLEEIIRPYVKQIEGQLFRVALFCSYNGYKQAIPLSELKGDAGDIISVNGQKKIIWTPSDIDVKILKIKDIDFKIEARLVYNPLQSLSLSKNKVKKKIKIFGIGGTENETISVSLYTENGQYVGNIGSYNIIKPYSFSQQISIPARINGTKVPRGKNNFYKLQVQFKNPYGKTQSIQSPSFILKRRGGALITTLLIAGTSTAIWYYFYTKNTSTELPSPPSPSN